MAEKKSAGARNSDTQIICGVTVRLVFTEEDNPQIVQAMRETLKASYNRRLDADSAGELLA